MERKLAAAILQKANEERNLAIRTAFGLLSANSQRIQRMTKTNRWCIRSINITLRKDL